MIQRCSTYFVFPGFCIFLVLGNPCGPNEYKSAKGECCPMCSIGK